MTIRPWVPIGEPEVLAEKYKRSLTLRTYEIPKTGKQEQFTSIVQPNWATILPIVKGPKQMVITVTQFKPGAGQIMMELPAGTAAWEGTSLTHEQVAVARLEKETGYTPGQVIALQTSSNGYWIASGGSPTRFHCFLALDCEPTPDGQDLANNEDIEYDLVPLQDWIKLIMYGSVSEPSAVVTTLRSLPYLGYVIK